MAKRRSLTAEVEHEGEQLAKWYRDNGPHVHPTWLVRRWVMCFGPSLKTICHSLRREGIVIVAAWKPGMCVWNTLKLRGSRSVIDRVLSQTGEKFARKCPPGAFE